MFSARGAAGVAQGNIGVGSLFLRGSGVLEPYRRRTVTGTSLGELRDLRRELSAAKYSCAPACW